MAEEKTNVMRILDQKRVPYTPHHYAHPNGAVDGASVAALLDRDPASVCKTLVTQGASRQHYVFIIPVLRSLDLKAAARAVGEKSIEMIPQARLLPLTGYVHGGCSPVGMKKQYPTVIHDTALRYDRIYVSGGRIGTTIVVNPRELASVCGAIFGNLCEEL